MDISEARSAYSAGLDERISAYKKTLEYAVVSAIVMAAAKSGERSTYVSFDQLKQSDLWKLMGFGITYLPKKIGIHW